MLPQDAISATPVYAEFLAPDSNAYNVLVDYEKGGVAIGDASQGRMVRDWTCTVEGDNIYGAPSTDLGDRTLLLTVPGVTTASLAFDSNMNVTLAYLQAGVLKLYWYNSLIEAYTTTSYPGATSGRVTTDDKRSGEEAASDVIFAYVRADVAYWRQQRDRYATEYTIGPAGGGLLTRIGMNGVNRLQFELLIEGTP